MQGTIHFTSPNQVPIPIGDTSGAKSIAHWLGNDIQYSTSSIDRWLAVFSDVSKGIKDDGYQGTGNAFSVSVTGTIVLLESEYVESHKVCLSIDQISAALEAYRQFLASDYKSRNPQPSPFLVEYLAEEDDASEQYSRYRKID